MTRFPTPSATDLDALLTMRHAQLQAHEVLALFAGALCGADLAFGPLNLLGDVFGDDPELGDNLEEANETMAALAGIWNHLAETAHQGMLLSAVPVSESPTREELAALAARRANEVMWFLRGLDTAGGIHNLGERAEFLVRRLEWEADLAKTKLDELAVMSHRAEGILEMERDNLHRTTERIEELMTELVGLSRNARAGFRGRRSA